MRFLQCVVIICLSFTMVAAQNAPTTMLGFDREGAARERTLEKQFDSFIKKDELRDWMKHLTARPHHLGSAYDKENADFMAGLFRSWGYETEIERFDVLFSTP
jgi:N-acetylated-alpha-linked acidic dipeptidase